MSFSSKIFSVDTVKMNDRTEQIVKGGRHLFPLLPKAFAGVKQIGVIGWGSQGPAQAQNLRDSLEGTGIKVKVGLRAGSGSMAEARKAGLLRGERHARRDVRRHPRIGHRAPAHLRRRAGASSSRRCSRACGPGATLGLSHGFLIGHLKNVGAKLPANINVIAVCPKGMGPSVRRLYVQGKEVNGAGINASIAVHQDIDGRATDYALGWSVALGSPYTFETTLESEYKSDIYGERGILLGAVHGIIESLYRRFVAQGMSRRGRVPQLGRVDHRADLEDHLEARHPRRLRGAGRRRQGRVRAGLHGRLPGGQEVLAEIYDEVSSGNEIRGVVLAGERLKKHPDGQDRRHRDLEGRRRRCAPSASRRRSPSNPFTAGVYIATMMAQIDILLEHGHPYSEVANESVIESVDSLNPYMHARGVAYMIDNCSTTARLGARKWAPRFDYLLTQVGVREPRRGQGRAIRRSSTRSRRT